MFEWIEANIAPHRVNVSGQRLEALRAEGIALGDMLERRYGAPMLRTNKSNKYYWTAGTWMGMVYSTRNPETNRNDRPRGRAYLFMDVNAAFEFKLKYA
ncbi:MAG: hypothetical protein EOO77_47505 [Oxalobacteraceae bacterium]|nr:MAG: hypothetical protein EOO77_47505 [Oxalobacteraceae bacterium]